MNNFAFPFGDALNPFWNKRCLGRISKKVEHLTPIRLYLNHTQTAAINFSLRTCSCIVERWWGGVAYRTISLRQGGFATLLISGTKCTSRCVCGVDQPSTCQVCVWSFNNPIYGNELDDRCTYRDARYCAAESEMSTERSTTYVILD